MKTLAPVLVAAVMLASATAGAGDAGAEHRLLAGAGGVAWGTPPPVLPPGAKFAVIDGDPAGTGMVTVRLMMPAGYRIPPHWHPTDEHVTVLSGVLNIHMGDVPDPARTATLIAGGYAVAPARAHHSAWTDSGAVVQIHLMGPFEIIYVNPADDPTQAGKK